jgi:hypothetical protein
MRAPDAQSSKSQRNHRAKGVWRPRQGYPPGYYAAFMLDPDGNNMEAVCREI